MRWVRPTDVGYGKLKFDKTDVLLAGALLVWVLTALYKDLRPWGWYVGGALLVIWVLVTLYINLRPKEG